MECVHGARAQGPVEVAADPGRMGPGLGGRRGGEPTGRPTPEARTGGQWGFDAASGLGAGGACPSQDAVEQTDGHCFARTRCGPKPASPAELETGDAIAVTRQPTGGLRCARALRRGSAHAPSPPARLPAFESNDRIGRTRLRQSTARVLRSAEGSSRQVHLLASVVQDWFFLRV